MRPVNLIPTEERRGQHAPARTGPMAPYLVLGLLAAALVGVIALVLTSNQISDRKAEIADLQAQHSALQARAEQLASYSQFRSVREQRTLTVASLADSRFDWERVLRELALVLPSDVWLVNVTGTASPDVETDDGAGIETRASVPGPALEIVGCAPGQEAVAGFVSALYDIDGVTRVGVAQSLRPDLAVQNGAAGSTAGAGQQGDDCRTRDFIARFEIVVAFDAAPVPGSTPTPAAPTATSPTSSAAAPSSEPEIADARQQEATASQSAASQTAKARRAVETFTP
jgi:Tfp pilus assembly protein PilN